MRRVMCVYFPHWPLQRLRHEQPELRDKPVVLCQPRTARKPLVLQCSQAAARLGIRPGLPVAEALALATDLSLHEADADGDRRALEALAERLGRYSPLVGVEDGPAPQSLLADITGCAPLFHGEDRLIKRAAQQLAAEGWTGRLASAGTLGAAWAVAHYVGTPQLVPSDQTERWLRPLPVAALRLPNKVCARLSELGIDTVGQLLALPRGEVPARFGADVLQRLDQALGQQAELILPWRPVPDLQASLRFDYPTDRWDVLHSVLEQLTEVVYGMLQERQWGARQLECWLHPETAPPLRLEVYLFQPSRSRAHLGALLRTRLEQVRVTAPVCAMDLRVLAAEPLAFRQTEWVNGSGAQARHELSALIDRLSNQIGREAVTRPTLVADPQPEYACAFPPVIDGTNANPKKRSLIEGLTTGPETMATAGPGHRPLWLLPRPIRIEVMRVVPEGPPHHFRWAGSEYRILSAQGPERIETGWWRGQDISRDYYIVTTDLGTRFWLFHCPEDGSWFLHGFFD